MPHTNHNPIHVSLFDELTQKLGSQVEIIRCTKSTLVQISHTLEDVVLSQRLRAMIFTGFQESSHWAKEVKRYQELVDTAQQVCIFAGKPLSEGPANALQVTLEGDDPLRQEWFVIILSEKFSVLLAGKDKLVPKQDESTREFDTIISFDPKIITQTLDHLESVLAVYRPDALVTLRENRQQYDLYKLDPHIVTYLTNKLMLFEEYLTAQLRKNLEYQKYLTDQMRIERDFSQQLIEFAPTPMLTLNLVGEIISANPAMQSILGYREADLMGKRFVEIFLDSKAANSFKWMLERALENITTMNYATCETEIHHTDNDEPATIIWRANTVRKSDQSPKFHLVIGDDVTFDRKAQRIISDEEQLRMTVKKERELANIKSDILTTISHELRTPVSTILSSTQMLQRYFDQLDETTRQRRLEKIVNQVDLITDMISDIESILKQENQVVQAELKPIRVSAVVRDVINSVLTRRNQLYRSVIVNTTLPDDTIKLDEKLFRGMLVNLLNNALQYSNNDTTVTIALSAINDQLCLKVIDHGRGIIVKDRNRIFEAFYRGQNTSDTKGLGLGLTVVKDFIDTHQGKIQLEETDGGGTTVTVYLPYTPVLSQAID